MPTSSSCTRNNCREVQAKRCVCTFNFPQCLTLNSTPRVARSRKRHRVQCAENLSLSLNYPMHADISCTLCVLQHIDLISSAVQFFSITAPSKRNAWRSQWIPPHALCFSLGTVWQAQCYMRRETIKMDSVQSQYMRINQILMCFIGQWPYQENWEKFLIQCVFVPAVFSQAIVQVNFSLNSSWM